MAIEKLNLRGAFTKLRKVPEALRAVVYRPSSERYRELMENAKRLRARGSEELASRFEAEAAGLVGNFSLRRRGRLASNASTPPAQPAGAGWRPYAATAVGGALLGGGTVWYLNATRHGRSNRELYRTGPYYY